MHRNKTTAPFPSSNLFPPRASRIQSSTRKLPRSGKAKRHLSPKIPAVLFKNLPEQCSDHRDTPGMAATAIINPKNTGTLLLVIPLQESVAPICRHKQMSVVCRRI